MLLSLSQHVSHKISKIWDSFIPVFSKFSTISPHVIYFHFPLHGMLDTQNRENFALLYCLFFAIFSSSNFAGWSDRVRPSVLNCFTLLFTFIICTSSRKLLHPRWRCYVPTCVTCTHKYIHDHLTKGRRGVCRITKLCFIKKHRRHTSFRFFSGKSDFFVLH